MFTPLPITQDYWSNTVFIETVFIKQCYTAHHRGESIQFALPSVCKAYPLLLSADVQQCSEPHLGTDPFDIVRPPLELFQNWCTTMIEPGIDLCFDEVAVKSHHLIHPYLIYCMTHRRASVGFKTWTLFTPKALYVGFDRAAVGYSELML